MSVELGLEINPEEFVAVVLLGGEDVRDEVIPIEEPPTPENVQVVRNRGDVGLLDPRGGRAVGIEDRRGRGSQFQLLIGKRKDGGRKLASSSGRGSHHQKEMVVVKVQEGWLFSLLPSVTIYFLSKAQSLSLGSIALNLAHQSLQSKGLLPRQ
jgi:hypothetical protein